MGGSKMWSVWYKGDRFVRVWGDENAVKIALKGYFKFHQDKFEESFEEWEENIVLEAEK